MKTVLFVSLLTATTAAHAIDVSPYRPGQVLNAEQAKELQQRYKSREQQAWKTPGSVNDIKKHENSELILYGVQVLDKTVATIGPQVKDSSKRYSGNSLNCTSCHLQGDTQLPGTKYDALPFTNVANDYPQFRARSMSIVTTAARVNGCMLRSMGNGRELPLDSKEMQGILAYFDWLAEGTKKDQAMQGTGVPAFDLPDRKADVAAGKKVYRLNCLACHGEKAAGMKAPDYKETGMYAFPPLAGNDSFNDDAGMSRLIKAAQFIRVNMPFGTNSKSPVLTVEQAYDVAAYVLSLPRSRREGREKDFPDANFRPAD
ncbi:MAG: c-type cytochrome [Gammaproteobacteria bacterium]|nr:c-type cytochrome [Gammaproteobacteria bacterium]